MIKQKIIRLFQIISRWPKKYTITGLVAFSIIVSGVVFMWPRQVAFSYHQRNCIDQAVIAPTVFKSNNQNGFRVVTEDELKIAGVSLLARKTCIYPVAAPTPGSHTANLAPFGWPIAAKTFTVIVSKPPVASIQPLQKQLPTTRPVKLPLNVPDKIFSYKLVVENDHLICKTNEHAINCDVEKLALKQGATYTMALERYFKNKKVATLTKMSVETLPATTVVDSSVKNNEIIYSKPKNLQIKLDKPITAAKVELVKIDDKARQPVSTKQLIKDNTVDVTWAEDLPRSATYELVLSEVVAKDGSSLVDPYKLPFRTSGGPKVTGINIGRSKVAIGAPAVITFDQPLSEKQDIAKSIAVGGGVSVTSVKGNQVFVSTSGVPKCGDFSLLIKDTLLSSYDISGGSAWQYGSRTICHSISSIGTSVKGRGIMAYYFGGGPNSIVYTGAIHGDELSTRSLMLRWIDELEANPRAIPADKTIVIIPVLNPDGAASGRRTNANNVDLNRNFDVSDWKKDVTTVTNAPFPGGGGPTPMSEPETKAIAGLVAQLRPRLVLSYHSVAGIVAANLAGDSAALAASYASISGYRNATGATASVFDYQITGTADDYYAEKLGVRSILIELSSSTYHQFEKNQKAMWAMMK